MKTGTFPRLAACFLGIALTPLSGCSDSSDVSADVEAHRSGVQIISTSLDLASLDLCWSTPSETVRVRLDEEMVDEDATRFLDLPFDGDVRVSVVSPEESCSSAGFDVTSSLSSADEGVVLVLAGTPEDGLDAHLLPSNSADGENLSLRGGCSGGDASATRTTQYFAGGGCSTRAVLYECRSVWINMGGPEPGFYSNRMVQTYDSGWVDCSDVVCGD